MGSDDPMLTSRHERVLTLMGMRDGVGRSHRGDAGWDRTDVVGLAGLGQAFPRSRLTLGQVKGMMRANEEGNPSKSVRARVTPSSALVRRRPATRAPGRPVVRVRPPDKVPDDLIEPTMSRQTS